MKVKPLTRLRPIPAAAIQGDADEVVTRVGARVAGHGANLLRETPVPPIGTG